MDYEELSNSFWFVVSAYILAFIPWTAITATDFIGSKWRTVKDTRRAGSRNLLWSFLPMAYVLFYGFVQGKAADYQEMCTAALAAIFAALMGLRTMWGLWQLSYFHSWATKSIAALEMFGIEYSLRLQDKELNRSSDIADEIFVNEKVIDNQVTHGDAQCYLMIGNRKLLEGSDYYIPHSSFDDRRLRNITDTLILILDPFYAALRWIVFPAAVLFEKLRASAAKTSTTSLRQVPKEPVELWVHWAAVFASQGLGKWMSQFEVSEDLNMPDLDIGKPAKKKFLERGQCFGSQLLGSATLHLWSEHSSGKGFSPLLWDIWKKDSEISDGRFVKQELFEEAIKEGIGLPYGASHWTPLRKLEENRDNMYYSYSAYQDMLGEFTAELPVKCSFVREMQKFDVNMLEWLTILLHIGHISLELGTRDMQHKCAVNACGECYEHMPSSSVHVEASLPQKHSPAGDVAISNLCQQLGIERRNYASITEKKGSQNSLSESEYPLSAIPVMRGVISFTSKGNRLVPKVGQLVDVWLSLVSGDEMEFLINELDGNWKNLCHGQEKDYQSNEEEYAMHSIQGLQERHKQLEMRRLARRVAHKNSHRYKYLDQLTTFMGYRMESVRTVVGRWLEENNGSRGDDFFRSASNGDSPNDLGIEVSLNEAMQWVLKQSGFEALERRGVQCQLVWTVQNSVEAMLLHEQGKYGEDESEITRIATIMLFLLSFPGLKLDVGNLQELPLSQNSRECCVINMGCVGNKEQEDAGTAHGTGSEHGFLNVDFRVLCRPQEIFVRAEIHISGKCILSLVNTDGKEFKWKWWRDAFLGRLEGFQEWQKDMGISPVTLELGKKENDGSALQDIGTAPYATARMWAEWPPFRPQFCRFEIESEHMLKQPVTIQQKNIFTNLPDINYNITRLPIQNIQSVSYHEAHEWLLKDSCRLVEDILKQMGSTQIDAPGSASNAQRSEILMRSGEHSISSGKLIFLQKDALHHGRAEAFKACMGMLREQGRIWEAIHLLRSYVGIWFSSNTGKDQKGRESVVTEVILPECERLITCYAGTKSQAENIVDVLNICLVVNLAKHEKQVILLMQQMLALHSNIESELYILQAMAKCFVFMEELRRRHHDGVRNDDLYASFGFEQSSSRETTRVALFILEKICVRSAIWKKAKSDNCGLRMSTAFQIMWAEAMNGLGKLLQKGSHGVQRDLPQAMQLYERAMTEGNSPNAMLNLGHILHYGAHGVPPDPPQAVKLYERAIEEGDLKSAMNTLGLLLQYGAHGVEPDPHRAVLLFERAIAKGLPGAMFNLGVLFHYGEGEVAPDALLSKKNYERAIEEANLPWALDCLGLLLEHGGHGVPPEPRQAMQHYEQAILADYPPAMINLASLLRRGAGGVPPDAQRALKLYERAVECSTEGSKEWVEAMEKMAEILRQGADGVERDMERAEELCTRAREKARVED